MAVGTPLAPRRGDEAIIKTFNEQFGNIDWKDVCPTLLFFKNVLNAVRFPLAIAGDHQEIEKLCSSERISGTHDKAVS
jgi:hypothetical protein